MTGGALGLLIAAGAVVPFPAASLGEEIRRTAESRLGVSLEMASTTLSLTRGLALRDAVARLSTDQLDLTARIDRVVATYALSLRKPLRVGAIRMIRPTVAVMVGARSADPRASVSLPKAATREEAGAGPDVDIDALGASSVAFGGADGVRVDLTLADLEVRSPGTNAFPLRVLGTTIELTGVSHDQTSSSLLHGLGGRGTMTARELWIGPMVMVDASSAITMGGGHLFLSDLTFWCDGRHFLLREVDIDFTADPLSLATPGSISERRRPGPSDPAEWIPIGSPTELDRLCGR